MSNCCNGKLDIPPKKFGFPGVNRKCAYCGAMFSEQSGHNCDKMEGYY